VCPIAACRAAAAGKLKPERVSYNLTKKFVALLSTGTVPVYVTKANCGMSLLPRGWRRFAW